MMMYANMIQGVFANGNPPYPVNQIEAAMRVLRHDGCLDSVSPREFVKLVFDACRELETFDNDSQREQFAATFGLSKPTWRAAP